MGKPEGIFAIFVNKIPPIIGKITTAPNALVLGKINRVAPTISKIPTMGISYRMVIKASMTRDIFSARSSGTGI